MNSADTQPITPVYVCLVCNRICRADTRCNCTGKQSVNKVRWLRMAAIHREAARIRPQEAAAHLADAQRLEEMAMGVL